MPGAEPTATSVVSDLLGAMNLTKSKLIFNSKTKYDNLEIDDRYGSYFLRFYNH